MSTAADRAARRGPDTVEVLRLRVEFEHVVPVVWRTLLIRATSPLSTLHGALQGAMGWHESHLHSFFEEREELLEWVGGDFDPIRFDVAEADARIASWLHRASNRV